MADGLVLSDDLMFASRITGTASSLGLGVKIARSPEQLLAMAAQEPPQGVMLDLANPGLEIAVFVQQLRQSCPVMPRLIAYGSHVDAATLQAARAAGCDQVMPRSKFVQELPTSLLAWLKN